MRFESLAQKRRRTARQVLARNKAAFAAYSTFHAQGERFSSCGNPKTDLVTIASIESSEHLCSGCQACVKIDGILKGKVEKGAVVKVVVTKFFFTVFERTFDLCESLELVSGNEGEGGAGVKCPIEPTTAEGLRACFPLDKSLPTGISASIWVTGMTAEKKQLFCVQGSAWIEGNCPAEYGPGSAACLGQ
ncbi:hypothetical protein EC957_005001 [Mortierella hygrophila]|uniref:Phosphatidylglycerol/phosphatidylinositol transfer protein n=1 Tax=Mortierella hygrophila TaxID=979708 RepID=A0A9P6FDS9_9FUNG|nr:hypothetical protein EC957_005001 [Mortierella hygrophila]